MIQTRVADLTVDEFKDMLRQVVTETVVELLTDPDTGLELSEEMKADLQRSMAVMQAGGETSSAETVAARLGLEW
jgi:hypothetical protein